MIKRFISGIATGGTTVKERRLGESKHSIRPQNMSALAVSVVDKLLEAGYEAYIVGGCVRDLILGKEPKDFDVATSATPEQVTRLFRRSRIIGRRFRIVHVQDRREIIEVTTFRGAHKETKSRHSSQSNQGVLLRDNVYGTLEDDAVRRDFTCNSLYFDIDSFEIVDFMGGVSDLKKGILRTIGDPNERFVEDPVRMMRAIRFQAKLGLKLDSVSKKALSKQMPMIKEVSAARMFDEVIKLLMHTESVTAFNLMYETGLFEQLFPWTAKQTSTNKRYKKMMDVAMQGTEKRLRNNKRVSPFYLYATLLWPAVEQEYQALIKKKEAPARAMEIAGAKVIDMQGPRITIAKRFAMSMRDTWYLQTQLDRRDGDRAEKMVDHPRFRAAYDFVLMREQAGEDLNGLGKWWTDYQSANTEQREKMSAAFKKPNSRKSNSRRRRKPATKKPAS